MKVIRSKTIGYCSGVKRTLDIAYKLVEEKDNCYVIGDIVHNKEVVEDLKSKGLKSIDNDTKDSIALVRTHGIGESKINHYKEKNIKIIDGTCPLVKRNHNIIKKVDNKTLVIIIGTKNHSEVKALCDVYNMNNEKVETIVISNENDINLIPIREKYLVISQTTADINLVNKLKSIIFDKLNNVNYINTICNEPKKRIDDLGYLFDKVEAIFVVGGFKSANTRLIYEYIKSKNIDTFLIENKNQITKEMLKYNIVGLTSGASTSNKIIDEIQYLLENS